MADEDGDGKLDFEEVDEKYCISFVFKGDWKARIKLKDGTLVEPDGGAAADATVAALPLT